MPAVSVHRDGVDGGALLLSARRGEASNCFRRNPRSRNQPTIGGNVKRRFTKRAACQLQFASDVSESSDAGRHLAASPVQPRSPTLPHMWERLAAQHGDSLALLDPHACPPSQYTFLQLADSIRLFASGLQSLGLELGDRVSLFSENSSRWLVADQGVMACGAADAVRGVSSSLEELQYIMQHSESSALIVQDADALDRLLPVLANSSTAAAGGANGSNGGDRQLAPLRPASSLIKFIVLLWGEPSAEAAAAGLPSPLTFDEVLQRGAAQPDGFRPPPAASGDDLATLVYTSGTTGHPKGVMLTHSNILYQVDQFDHFVDVAPGDRTLSLLPPWHIYERTCAYFILSRAAAQVFTSIRRFRDDLSAHPPDHFVCVPLVLDTLHTRVLAALKKATAVRRALAAALLAVAAAYTSAGRVVRGVAVEWARSPRPVAALVKAWLTVALLAPLNWLAQRLVVSKIRAALGIRKTVISGGGSLAPHLDLFFESVGLAVLNGWGLTESSPVLACRRNKALPAGNVRGSVGRPIPGTEVKVVDPETHAELPDGRQGLLLARGPGVMLGYYNDAAATAAAFSEGRGSWFDTGDLGWRAPAGVAGSDMAGCIVLTGRAKDTIVLTSGENVEPQPIEDAICCSPYVKFAVLVGHAHRALGALLVPDCDALAELAAARGSPALTRAEVAALLKGEVAAACAGRIRWEHVAAVSVLAEPFSVDDGTLTRTMKPRRAAIMRKYAAEVAALEAKLR